MSTEHLILTQLRSTPKPTGRLPEPPVFKVNGLKYTVPPYYTYQHSETQWITNMLKSDNWDRILRVISVNPEYLMNTYCQYPDSPDPNLGAPMFQRKAILYLTPLGMAIYLLKPRMVRRILAYSAEHGQHLNLVNQPCFVTNYLERFENRNDIMIIYPFCILYRRECFGCVEALLDYGWLPQTPIQLPYRRICQIYNFHYKDIVEYCLAQMSLRPNLQLYKLIERLMLSLHPSFDIMRFEKILIRDSSNQEIEDYISIPRRLLRYLQYYDKDLLLLSQLVLAVKVTQRHGFFVGPRRYCWDCKFEKSGTDQPEQKVIMDQDNIIALMLSLSDLAEMKGHVQSKEKLLELLAFVLVDTKWFVKMLISDNQIISDYFSNLNERVDKIKFVSIELARIKLMYILDIMDVNLKNIEELYNSTCPRNNWKDNLNLYLEKHKDKLEIKDVAKIDSIGPDISGSKKTPPTSNTQNHVEFSKSAENSNKSVSNRSNKSNMSHRSNKDVGNNSNYADQKDKNNAAQLELCSISFISIDDDDLPQQPPIFFEEAPQLLLYDDNEKDDDEFDN